MAYDLCRLAKIFENLVKGPFTSYHFFLLPFMVKNLSPQGSFHHITVVEEHEKDANEAQAGWHT